MAKQSSQIVPAQQRGRPVVHSEPWERITVVMSERHVAYLDVMCVLIRLRHHKAISRAEIIRAFVEFMIRSPINFQQFATIEEMVTYLTAYFRRQPNRRQLRQLLLESSLFQTEGATTRQQTPDREQSEVGEG